VPRTDPVNKSAADIFTFLGMPSGDPPAQAGRVAAGLFHIWQSPRNQNPSFGILRVARARFGPGALMFDLLDRRVAK